MTICDYETFRLEGFNVIVLLWNESGDLYSFVVDLSADGYGVKELAMNAVANDQVWHGWLSHLHAQSLEILRKRHGTGTSCEGTVSDCDVCAMGKAQQLAHPKTKHKVNRHFQLCYRDPKWPFTPVAIVEYASKVIDEFIKWAAVYSLTNKNQAFRFLQLLVSSMVIPFGDRIVYGAPTRAASTPGKSFGGTARRSVLSQGSPPPTRRSKSVCPNAWGGLCAPWFDACPQKTAFHRPCGGGVNMTDAYFKHRTPHMAPKI